MSQPDFESDLKVEVAAQDSDMVGFFEINMLGDTRAIDPDRALDLEDYDPKQLDGETKAIYGLSPQQLALAKTLAIGRIAGVKIGREFFHD